MLDYFRRERNHAAVQAICLVASISSFDVKPKKKAIFRLNVDKNNGRHDEEKQTSQHRGKAGLYERDSEEKRGERTTAFCFSLCLFRKSLLYLSVERF